MFGNVTTTKKLTIWCLC